MNTTKAIIGLLAAAVVVVAILMYVPFETPAPSDLAPAGTSTSNLSADEQRVLTPPGESATPEELDAYNKLAWGLAQETASISVGASCQATPVVINVEDGATLSVKNTDSAPHTLAFDDDHSLVVAPGETKAIDLSFLSAGRLYAYSCDSSGGPVGVVIVSE